MERTYKSITDLPEILEVSDGDKLLAHHNGRAYQADATLFHGNNATINGEPAIEIEAGENITLTQDGTTFTISADGAINTVKVNGTALSIVQKAVDILIASGTANGTISVNGADISVTGLSAALTALSTLIGNDANKSARTIALEELAAQLIPQDAQAAMDTLQEIAAWIQAHPDDAAAINAKLTLGTHEVDGQQVQYATVKAYVEAMVTGLITLASLSASVSGAGNAITGVSYDNTTGAFAFTKGTTFLTQHQDISGKQDKLPVTGAANKGVYVSAAGVVSPMTYELNKSVPANAVFTDTNTTYTLTQDATDGHKFTLTGSDGTSKTITIPDNNTTYTLASLGIGDVKNYDQSKAIKSITRSGTTFTYTCLDNTTGTFTQQDNNTWTAMTGATSSANGTAGYVPAPPKDGYNTKYLRADGTWTVPPDTNTTYTPASASPLMDGTAAVGSSAKYAREDHRHPTDTSRASTAVATQSANGLMTGADKAKLDGIETNANNYYLPTASASTLGGVKVGSNLSISDGVLSSSDTFKTTKNMPISSLSDDTSANWDAAGNGIFYCSTENLTNEQPGTWGFIYNMTFGGDVHQIWYTQSNGNQYYRGANIYTTAMPAWKPTDTTYSTATSSANGLMSSTDKAKLDSISLPTDGISMPVILANQSVANFTSAAAGRPLHVTVHIEPVQAAGTPSPSNPLPIMGWTGVNVMRMGKNLVFKEIPNALVYTNGTFARHESAKVAVAKVLAGYTYAFNVNVPGQNFVSVGFFYNTPALGDKTYNQSRIDATSGTFTAPISGYAVINITSTVTDPIQVEYGAASTSYAAPETPVAISFPASAGTVYGGTLDVAQGLLTVTHNYVRITSVSRNNNTFFYYTTSALNKGKASRTDVVCDKMRSRAGGTTGASLDNNGNLIFVLPEPGYASIGEFMSAYGESLDVVYPLETPLTYQFTPQQIVTLEETNNVFADCGPVTVTHWPGTGMPVEPVEDGAEIAWKKGILDRIIALEGG